MKLPLCLSAHRPGAAVIATAMLATLATSPAAFAQMRNAAQPPAPAIAPIVACNAAGIGSTTLFSDLPTLPTSNPPNDTSVTIVDVSTGTTAAPASQPYCLVKLLVKPAINIWVALPTGNSWNGKLQSEGGGGYAGAVGVASGSVNGGYIGVQTDTGHVGGSGTFGMLTPVPAGAPDVQLQTDFAYRSEHLMAHLGKQLALAYYGQFPVRSYWNGCSTGGRQGLRMAQDFPDDYDGILAGAPAIHWDRFQAYQIWPQIAMRLDAGGPIATAKLTLATNAAIAACDAIDGVVDGLLTDPRACTYNPVNDATITKPSCTTTDNTCLRPSEASAIQKIWSGPAFEEGRKLLWFPLQRGAALNGLGGTSPFAIAVAQPRYWVYFDPSWDWTTLDYGNYQSFFRKSVEMVGPLMASANPNLAAFRSRGGKIISWHGWADQLIMPEGTPLYYDAVTRTLGGGYAATQSFYRLFMAPGVGHCGGGAGPQPQGLFQAVVDWVESGVAPATLLSTNVTSGVVTRSRPLCPYPAKAVYTGSGSINDATSFACQ